jgi:DNA-binding LytR/AlgR family response regulator
MLVNSVFLRDGAQHVRVSVHEILYLEADDNSTRVYCEARVYVVGRMLKEVLDEMGGERLERIHRSYAVNLDHVQAISDNGLHVRDRWLPIGRSYRSAVLQRLRMI